MTYIVALTGGIGSGKTTVANAFAELGVPLIDADIIARQVVEPGTYALNAIRVHFGSEIILPDGTLNRKLLRQIIFDSPTEKQWINQLLHPVIAKETQRQIQNTKAPYILWVVPLLIENNLVQHADRVLVVDVTPQEQLLRTAARDRVKQSHVEKIIAAQTSREQRLNLADDIISNHDGNNTLKENVFALHKKYLELAAQQTGSSNE